MELFSATELFIGFAVICFILFMLFVLLDICIDAVIERKKLNAKTKKE